MPLHPTKPSTRLRHALLICCAGVVLCACGESSPGVDTIDVTAPSGVLQARVLATGLDTPWDLAMAPDGFIWVTERRGVISRIDPNNGNVEEVGRLSVVEESESGLMGMAFHPDFPNAAEVYLVYSYQLQGNSVINNRLVRMTYVGGSLGNEEILLDEIRGNRIHDGARLTVGPDRLLYLTMGDAGLASSAQDTASLIGKVLRLDLNGQPAPGNPFGSAVYSFGHRNPQGIIHNPVTGDLYVTEHGPSDNDEVNRILPGGNYGWPDVRGFCDNDIAGLDELTVCAERGVIEPMTAYTPTIAPSGMDYYGSDLIPNWKGSLLFTTLKDASLYRLQLSSDGLSVVDQEVLYKGVFGRLRDVLVAPDGRVYLATSNRDGRGNPLPDDDRIIVLSP